MKQVLELKINKYNKTILTLLGFVFILWLFREWLYNYLTMEKTIHIYVDESGVLSRNAQEDFFLYAGIVFYDNKVKNKIKRKYLTIEKRITKSKEAGFEAKGSNLKIKHKNSLYRIVKNQTTFVVETKISNIESKILDDKRSIQRFKDYMLCRIVKEVLRELISSGIIAKDEIINVNLQVDQQNVSSNGKYDLQETIRTELFIGKYTNRGNYLPPVFSCKGNVKVTYQDSKYSTLIRAADIIANRKFYYKKNNKEFKLKDNHTYLKLP